MAAKDDLVRALAQGQCPGALLTTLGVTGSTAADFKRNVEDRKPRIVVPAAIATALGASSAYISLALGRGDGYGVVTGKG